MKYNVLIVSVFLLFLTKHANALQEDTMDSKKQRIDLSAPAPEYGYFSSGILKSHKGLSYAYGRSKTLLVTAPSGYSIMVAIKYIDLRPNSQDVLTLSSTKGLPIPRSYSNTHSDRFKQKFYEKETYYVSNGNLSITFTTGPYYLTAGYDGFELVYTVQGIPEWNQCNNGNFQCDNGRCIAYILTCDGHNHCGDGSSQKNCFPSGRIGRTIGIVFGSLFLLSAVLFGLYYVCRRRRFGQQSQTIITSHPPPPTNLPSYPPVHPYPSTQYPPPPPANSTGITNPTYH